MPHQDRVAFAKTSFVDGVWISHEGGDVHVYHDIQHRAMVFGHNKTDKVKFTDPAIVLAEDGSMSLQTSDDAGNVMHTPIRAEDFAGAFSSFLCEFARYVTRPRQPILFKAEDIPCVG